jgi:hypothetical protein
VDSRGIASEPVSARRFPVPREKTGKFADFGLEIAEASRLSEENSSAYQENSLVAKAGKILPEAGNSELCPAGSYEATK